MTYYLLNAKSYAEIYNSGHSLSQYFAEASRPCRTYREIPSKSSADMILLK